MTRDAALALGDAGVAASRNAAIEVKEHLPGDRDVWVFVIGEMVVFAAYFGAYMVDRGRNHELFLQSQQLLSQRLGVINTLVLVASSLFVALSVQAARTANVGIASGWLALGGACGAAFASIKCFEWYAKLRAGVTIGTNAFFMHYYVMTGVHLFHLLLGLVILAILWRELHQTNPPRAQVMESGACYWHAIDLLWIVIFAVLYVIRQMMRSSFRGTLTGVWAMLSIMTIASWWTGSRSDGRADTFITAGVLLFALIKSRLVMRHFMEVRFAPRWLRLTCDVWLIMVFGMIFALYWGPL